MYCHHAPCAVCLCRVGRRNGIDKSSRYYVANFLYDRKCNSNVYEEFALFSSSNDEIEIEYDDLVNKWKQAGKDLKKFNIHQALLQFDDDSAEDDILDLDAVNSKESLNARTVDSNYTGKVHNDKKISLLRSTRERKKDLLTSPQKQLLVQGNVNITDTHGSSVTSKSVGIDLGTTNSAISLIENGQPRIIPVDGLRVIPSIVSYTKTSNDTVQITVGKTAERFLIPNPLNTFSSVKRLIGRLDINVKPQLQSMSAIARSSTRDFMFELKSRRRNLNNQVITTAATDSRSNIISKTRFQCPALGMDLSPEEVSAQILRHLLNAGNDYLAKNNSLTLNCANITRAVITVPAYFTPDQFRGDKN